MDIDRQLADTSASEDLVHVDSVNKQLWSKANSLQHTAMLRLAIK